MWIYFLLIITSCLAPNIHGSPVKKDDLPAKPIRFPDDKTHLEPVDTNRAIIAIQIINSTAAGNTKSNSKRTIETSLGYGGYQGNNFYYKTQDGKFEIYPYSQHDIPNPRNHGKSNTYSNVDIQQAYSYIVGKKQQQTQNYQYSKPQHYQQPEYTQVGQQSVNTGYSTYPTTLFSTLNQGQIGGLSSHIPTQFVQYPVSSGGPHGTQNQLQIPVIVLRVYSDQLSHSNEIYPNLPASNPYASYINMINLQTLLNGYMANNVYSAPAGHSGHQYLPMAQQHDDLPLTENYPKSTHTQVLLKPKKQYYKSSKASHAAGVAVTTPSGFSYKALPQQTEYVYQNEANSGQQYVAQGNEYSVPVPGAPNYYQNPQAYENTAHHAPYGTAENQQTYQNAQPEYEYSQQTYQEQYSGQATNQQHLSKTQDDKDSQTQYIYINEHELSNHGYVFKNPATGEYMYYPSMGSMQHQTGHQTTQYSLPDPIQNQETAEYSTPSPQVNQHATDVRPVTEKTQHKLYNYHAQSPRHAMHSSQEQRYATGRTKKNKSSPLVLAPQEN